MSYEFLLLRQKRSLTPMCLLSHSIFSYVAACMLTTLINNIYRDGICEKVLTFPRVMTGIDLP